MFDLDTSNSILNESDEQGIDFLDYRNKNNSSMDINLIEQSSSPGIGSIIEAVDGQDSLTSYKSELQKKLSANQTLFQTKLSAYTTKYNTYISSAYITKLKNNSIPTVSDTSANILIVAELNTLNGELIALARTIIQDINGLNTNDISLRQQIQTKRAKLINYIEELEEQREYLSDYMQHYDTESVDGAIETSVLHMNSVYVHYIVYFFIGLTLIVFIFNITINPEADVMRSVFLLVALFAVYIISRWVNK